MDIEKIREDFPALEQEFNGKPVIYFDSACMTLRPREVVEAMDEYYFKYPACHGRSVHKFALKVTEKYEEARERMQKFLGAKESKEIIFIRNTTEGMNLVINSFDLKKGDIILTTDREHNSTLMPCQFLAREKGVRHEIVYSNNDNIFNLEKFEEQINDKVKLVSMVHTSNLDGYTVPAKEVIKIAHDNGSLVLFDGAQSAPHKELDVRDLDVDFFAFSAHKMLGPSGVGVLYGKYDLLEKLDPFLVGGETVSDTTYTSAELMKPPSKFEAGLQNYAGAIGAGVAAEYLRRVGKKNIDKHEVELNKLATELVSDIPEVKIIGPADPELRAGILNIVVEGMDPHDLSIILDETANIMVRSGRHCVHSWYNAHDIEGSVRASFYIYNTEEEVRTYAETLKKVIEQLK